MSVFTGRAAYWMNEFNYNPGSLRENRIAMLALLNVTILTASLAFAPQVRERDWANTGILYTATNAKYHLVCEFHGGRKATPRGTSQDSISSVIIRDEQTGEAVTYNPPIDLTGSDRPSYSNHDVWSPDNEWLVLSLGSYAGYQLIKAKDALVELRHPQPKEFLVLAGQKYKDGLYHEFLGWQSPATFSFDVTGDFRTNSLYQFDLKRMKLIPLFQGESVADTYTTSERKQAIPIEPGTATPPRK